MSSVVVVADDRAGLLTDISYILGKEGIRMDDVDVDAAGGKVVIALSVRDNERTKSVLRKNGLETMSDDTVIVRLPEFIKRIDDVKQLLEDKKVMLKDMKVLSRYNDRSLVALSVDRPRVAHKLLNDFVV